MKSIVRSLVALVCVFSFSLVSVVSPFSAQATGLLGICQGGGGTPCNANQRVFFPIYQNSTLVYRIDPSAVGDINGAIAFSDIEDTFSAWEDESTLNFNRAGNGMIAVDVTTANVFDFLFVNTPLGFSPVILDEDGSITDLVFGGGSKNSILGFAGASFFSVSGNQITGITESQAAFNGFLFTAAVQGSVDNARREFKSTAIHEFGHAVGFDHTQGGFVQKLVDLQNGIPTNNLDDIPIMFPVNISPTCAPPAFNCQLTRDDIATAGFYPNANFPTSTGTINGRVIDGGNPVFGANVIAYNVNDPNNQNVASASDVDALGDGNFKMPGLLPGEYIVKVEPINAQFTGGSSVGVHDPPNNPNSIPSAFYAGEGNDLLEIGLNAALNQATRITVNAGQSVNNITMNIGGTVNPPPPAGPSVELRGRAFNKLIRLKTSKPVRAKYTLRKLLPGESFNLTMSTQSPNLVQFNKPNVTFSAKRKRSKGRATLATLDAWVAEFPELLNGDLVEIPVTATDTTNGTEVNGVITVFAPASALNP